jgi:hypothetical protein
VVIVNAGHPEGNFDLEKVLAATMAEAFPTVLRDPVEETNTLLLGSDAAVSPRALERIASSFPIDLESVALVEASRLEPPLPGGEVYTDDKAPVEWLIDRSLLGYAEE